MEGFRLTGNTEIIMQIKKETEPIRRAVARFCRDMDMTLEPMAGHGKIYLREPEHGCMEPESYRIWAGDGQCLIRLAFALFVAMLLNKDHKCLGLYRTLYYVPSIIGGSIAVSVVWKQIFGNKGVVMTLLSVFGIHQATSFLGNPKTALGIIILMGVWQFGSSMLIFLSALKQIPGALYESAKVDGAKQGYIFWKITLPMLTPTIFFNLILQIINGFRVFTESYVITDGGPLDSTLSYVLYLYRRAFTFFDMGYSCALAWILVAIIAVFTVIIFKTQKNWVYYESEEG